MSEGRNIEIRNINQCCEILLNDHYNQIGYDEAIAYAQQNFIQLYESDSFIQLKLETFTKIMESNELNIMNEDIVIDAVYKWLDNNRLNYIEYLKSALKVVRFHLLPPNLIMKYLSNIVEPYIHSSHCSKDLLIEVLLQQFLTDERKKYPARNQCGKKILSIGSYDLNTSNTIEIYDKNLKEWTEPKHLSINRRNYSVALINYELLLIGGTYSWDKDTEPLNKVESLNLSNGILSPVAPLNDDRQYAATVVIGEGISAYLFVIGGWGKGKLLNSIERWDPVDRKWMRKKNMSEAKTGPGAVLLNGKIYVLGGRSDQSYTKTMEAYDLQNDQWERKSDMKTTKAYFGVTAFKNFIYVVAGYTEYPKPVNTVERYDSINDSWISLANIITTGFVGVCILNNRVICAGGKGNTVQEYDDENNKWSSLKNLHIPREGYLMNLPGQMNNFEFDWAEKNSSKKLLSVGSYYTKTGNIVEIFDVENLKWKRLKDRNIFKKEYGAVIIGEKLLIIGGNNDKVTLNTVESIDLLNGNMTSLPPMKYARAYPTSVVVKRGNEEYVYVLGGWGINALLASVEMWDPRTSKWTEVAEMITTRTGHGAAVLNGFIYVAGGRIGEPYLNTVEAYHIESSTWQKKAPMIHKNAYFGMCSHRNYLYVVGGYADPSNKLNIVERYDPVANSWIALANIISKGGVGICSIENRLICSGGSTEVVQEYNEKNNIWISLPPMKTARDSFLLEIPKTLRHNDFDWK